MQARGFRRDVEGLRAVAVALVVIYHAWGWALPAGYVGVDVFFVISGYLITGLLTKELAERGSVSLGGFYARRARRILPAATLVIAVTVAASAIAFDGLRARAVAADGVWASVFALNYRLAVEGSNYLNAGQPASPLQHYWSLSVEEQFYALWPVLLVAASLVWWRKRPHPSVRTVTVVLGLVALGSFTLAVLQSETSPSFDYYSLLTRAWELAAGGLLALWSDSIARLDGRAVWDRWLAPSMTWLGLAAVITAAVVFSDSTPFPGWAALVPVIGAVLVIGGGIAAASRRLGAERLLGWRPFQATGKRSYSIYLWHYPFLVLGAAFLGGRLLAGERFGLVVASLVVAAICYKYVEYPIRSKKSLVAKPRRGLGLGVALASGAVAVCLIVPVALPSLQGTGTAAAALAPLRLPSLARASGGDPGGTTLSGQSLAAAVSELTGRVQAALSAGLKLRAVPQNLTPSITAAASDLPIVYSDGCQVGLNATTSPPCVFGDTSSSRTVVLFGDSHAAQWFPALEAVSLEEHWRLVDLTKSGCPAPEVLVPRPKTQGAVPYTECNEWRSSSEGRIDAMRPFLVVVSWYRLNAKYAKVPPREPGQPPVTRKYHSAWLDGADETLEALAASGAKVVFLSDTPKLAVAAPECLAGNLRDSRACDPKESRAVILGAVKAAEIRIATALKVAVIDPTPWFCTPRACPVIVGNTLVYLDIDHATPQYMEWIAPLFRLALLEALSTNGTANS